MMVDVKEKAMLLFIMACIFLLGYVIGKGG